MNPIDILSNIRSLFLKHNLKIPRAIILNSHEDGMQFLSSLAQNQLALSKPDNLKIIEHSDGSSWQSMMVMGIEIHWPANIIATKSSRYRLE